MSANKKSFTNTWVDPDDASELTEEFFTQATKMIGNDEVSAEIFASAVKSTRGKQKRAIKDRITIRLSHDTVEHLRATGRGWQTRLDIKLHDLIARGEL